MGNGMQESVSLKPVNAEELLDKIKNGEQIKYNGYIINGDIDITKANVPKENGKYNIRSRIRITHSKIEGSVDFNGSIFKEKVDFKDCDFLKHVSFNKSIFKADTHLGYSKYKKLVSFIDSQFEGNISFNESQFYEESSFKESKFDKDAYFRKSCFKGDLNLNDSHFKGFASFRNSNFRGKLNSNRCHFEGDAYFKESKFEGDTYFRESKFNQDADFSQSIFTGSIVDFESAHFVGDASFDDVSFKEKLSLSRTKYEKLYIRWKNITKSKCPWRYLENCSRISRLNYERDHGDATYLSLIENFKKLGLFEDADNCYYCYRNERRKDLPVFYKQTDWLLKIFYGYGVRPIRPLAWAVIFFLAFGLLFTTHGEFLGLAKTTSPINAINISYTLLLSGTKLIDDPNHAPNGILYLIFTIEKLLGSLFFALFLISVGRTIVR